MPLNAQCGLKPQCAWGERDNAKPEEYDLTPNPSHDLYPPFPIHRDKLGTFSKGERNGLLHLMRESDKKWNFLLVSDFSFTRNADETAMR